MIYVLSYFIGETSNEGFSAPRIRFFKADFDAMGVEEAIKAMGYATAQKAEHRHVVIGTVTDDAVLAKESATSL